MGFNRILRTIINLATKATGREITEYTLVDRFPFDDFDRVNIEMEIENYFHINFLPVDNQLSKVESIYDLALLVEKLLKKQEN